jgi:predicted dehydrogenase
VRSGAIGKPLLCHWADYFLVTTDNKYYGTAWRRSGTFPGGFLMDSGVHRSAVLRLVLGEIADVTAATAQIRPDLPPADTLCSTLRFDNGVVGTYSMTVAVRPTWSPSLYIVGEQGTVEAHRRGFAVTNDGRTRTKTIPDYSDTHAIRAELESFAAAILQDRPHCNTPEQALQDVAVVEALLRSAETGRRTAPDRVV